MHTLFKYIIVNVIFLGNHQLDIHYVHLCQNHIVKGNTSNIGIIKGQYTLRNNCKFTAI